MWMISIPFMVFLFVSGLRSVWQDLEQEDRLRQETAQQHKDILAMERGIKRLRGQW